MEHSMEHSVENSIGPLDHLWQQAGISLLEGRVARILAVVFALIPDDSIDCHVGERRDLSIPQATWLLVRLCCMRAVAISDGQAIAVDVVFAVPVRAGVLVIDRYPCFNDRSSPRGLDDPERRFLAFCLQVERSPCSIPAGGRE